MAHIKTFANTQRNKSVCLGKEKKKSFRCVSDTKLHEAKTELWHTGTHLPTKTDQQKTQCLKKIIRQNGNDKSKKKAALTKYPSCMTVCHEQ